MDDQPPDVATDELRAEMYERFGRRDRLLKAIRQAPRPANVRRSDPCYPSRTCSTSSSDGKE